MIKWKSDVFKHLNNFDIVTMDEIIDMYKKQYEYLIDDGYEPTHKDDKFEYKIVADEMFEKINNLKNLFHIDVFYYSNLIVLYY